MHRRKRPYALYKGYPERSDKERRGNGTDAGYQQVSPDSAYRSSRSQQGKRS